MKLHLVINGQGGGEFVFLFPFLCLFPFPPRDLIRHRATKRRPRKRTTIPAPTRNSPNTDPPTPTPGVTKGYDQQKRSRHLTTNTRSSSYLSLPVP